MLFLWKVLVDGVFIIHLDCMHLFILDLLTRNKYQFKETADYNFQNLCEKTLLTILNLLSI